MNMILTRNYNRWLTRLGHYVNRPPRTPLPNTRPQVNDQSLFRKLLFMRLPQKLALSILGIAFGLLSLAVPISHKFAVAALVSGKNTDSLWLFIAGFALFFAARLLFFGINLLSQREAVVAETWLGRAIYHHSLTVRPEYQSRKTTGELVGLLSSHLTLISFFLTDLFPSVFTAIIPVLMIPWVVSIGFGVSPWPLLLALLGSIGLCIIMAKMTSTHYQSYKRADDQRLAKVNEWIKNLRSLRALGWMERMEYSLANMTTLTMRKRQIVIAWANLMSSFAATSPLIFNVIALVGLLVWTNGALKTEDVFGLLWLVAVFMVVPMRTLPWFFVLYFDAKTSIERIEDFLKLPAFKNPDSTPTGESLSMANDVYNSQQQLGLRVQGLNYCIETTPILIDCNLEIAPGEFVAIVGNVGSGKSMLLQCLMGETLGTFESYQFIASDAYQPIAIEEISQSHDLFGTAGQRIRQYFGFVPQEAFMFPAKLAENVLFAYSESLEHPLVSKITESLKRAAMNPDLDHMPHREHTQLGERGINLSGGQRQRLEIARMDFHDRPILLLDDPFSALDVTTEKYLLEHLLLGHWKHKTRILVSHRLSVLNYVDKVIFMDSGRIIAIDALHKLKELPQFVQFIETIAHE